MCGFAGEFVFGDTPADVDLAAAMAGRLMHRGPDEAGSFLSADRRCAIGFRRLAVIDPAGSHQPMTSEDGLVTVAWNGEIYNYRKLREELRGSGATFQTAGDTEVLLHLYRRHAGQIAEHLVGMFAVVVYDSLQGRLLLVRDRFGQKPLWFSLLEDRIVFASEAKALLGHPKIGQDLSKVGLEQYVSLGYVAAPNSIWEGICKLLPGQELHVSGDGVKRGSYYQVKCKSITGDGQETLDRVRHGVSQAVSEAMVSDVPIGALLSGGIDSSIVVGLMAKAAGRVGGVRTFTAGFDEEAYDERRRARVVAKHFGSEHEELLVERPGVSALDRVVKVYDEPFGDSSAVATLALCEAVSRHVKVALVGDGGDECFGGYDRYRALQLADEMGPLAYALTMGAAKLTKALSGGDQRGVIGRFKRFVGGINLPPAMQYFYYRRLFGANDLAKLFSEGFADDMDLNTTRDWFCRLYEEGDCGDEVSRAQRHDMLTYLPDDLLVKTDRASMASSLELRSPMLAWRVAELGLSLPVKLKVNRRRGKVALREAFRDILPREVLTGRKKGFGLPLGRWLRGAMRPVMIETLTDRSFLKRGIFREGSVVGLINDHLSKREDHSQRLWMLMVLARWLEVT